MADEISKGCHSRLFLSLFPQTMSRRFFPHDVIKTDAVLSLDEDSVLSTNEVKLCDVYTTGHNGHWEHYYRQNKQIRDTITETINILQTQLQTQ